MKCKKMVALLAAAALALSIMAGCAKSGAESNGGIDLTKVNETVQAEGCEVRVTSSSKLRQAVEGAAALVADYEEGEVSAGTVQFYIRTPNKTEKRSKRQQGRKKPNGYQPCVHIGRAGACIDGTRQRFAQQPSGAFQDERNCPPHVWQYGALYVSLCTPVCKTENRTLYQREVSEDGKWVSRANFAGRADDPAYIPTFCNHSHWRQ